MRIIFYRRRSKQRESEQERAATQRAGHPQSPFRNVTAHGFVHLVCREFDDNGDNYVEMDEWLFHVIGQIPDVKHAELDDGVSSEQYERDVRNRWAKQLHDSDSDRDGRLSFQVAMSGIRRCLVHSNPCNLPPPPPPPPSPPHSKM